MKESAGTLLYRIKSDQLEVLLVHASGNYNRKAPWGIPKGEAEPGEDLEATARRETLEETGLLALDLESLGFMVYTKSRKRVHCFGGNAADDAEPKCASWEIDKAEFVSIEKARSLIHQDQAIFLDRLQGKLRSRATP